jgi:hypothetical protein
MEVGRGRLECLAHRHTVDTSEGRCYPGRNSNLLPLCNTNNSYVFHNNPWHHPFMKVSSSYRIVSYLVMSVIINQGMLFSNRSPCVLVSLGRPSSLFLAYPPVYLLDSTTALSDSDVERKP